MDFQAVFDNYKRVLTKHYFDMNGRVGRPEFWWFVLANLVAALLASIVGGILGLPLAQLYNLAVLLPAMTIGARRLQDVGKDGRLVWIVFALMAVLQVVGILTALTFAAAGMFGLLFLPGLSLIGIVCLVLFVVLIWFWCQPGDPGPNAYGPVPPVFDANRRVMPSP